MKTTGTRRRLALRLKRGIDLVGAGVGIAALSPVIAGIAAGIAVTQGRPVFFQIGRAHV